MTIGVGVIGLGVGEAHLRAYSEISNVQILGVCDFSSDKIQKATGLFPEARVYNTAEEMLDDPSIHAVSIASYDSYHADQVIRAIKNGKHVFVEKPLCLTRVEGEQIRKALNDSPTTILSSNLVLRRFPRFSELQKRVEREDLGRLYYIEGAYDYGRIHKITEGWRSEGYYSVMLGGGIHLIDLILWLSKDTVTEVRAVGNQICTKGTNFKHPDLVSALLTFSSGMIAKVTANFGCVRPHFHELSVFGTKGTFVNEEASAKYYLSREANTPPEQSELPYPGVGKGIFIESFIEAIQKDTKPEVSSEDVFKALSVGLSIDESLKSGNTERVIYI